LIKESGKVVGVRARATNNGIEREILARWTIGDDGGHSVVRNECDIDMAATAFPVDLLSFAVSWPLSVEPGTGCAWINPERTRTGLFVIAALARPGGKGSALIAVRPRLFQEDNAVQKAIETFCATDSRLAEIIGGRRYPQEIVRVRLSWGHAASYGTDGVVLIGDAAHAVTPAGGQGANLAIADARVLAEVALTDETRLVSEYERRRRPANQRSMSLSRTASRVFSLPDSILAPPIPILFMLLNCFPRLFARGLRFASRAFLETAS
jgi:2-polyprenyl-6-methoxyphenol hydroxylase-like FAD-dependent oxidoreductase